MTKKILIADNEQDFLRLVKLSLKREGYNILTAYNGNEALEKALARPDLILLDVALPEINGWEVAKALQQNIQTRHIPFIFVTNKSKDIDEIVGLELGATDFITKPISEGNLTARIRAALRKNNGSVKGLDREVFRIEGLEIDIQNFAVRIEGKYVVFPKKEFEILATLVNHKGSVLSRQSILDMVWGNYSDVYDRTVDVHITKIRSKLGKYGPLIETLKRVGYRFSV